MIISKEQAIKVAKGTFKIAATIGAGLIVKGIIDAVVPKTANKLARITIVVGGYVIGDSIVNKIETEADKTWERTCSIFKQCS